MRRTRTAPGQRRRQPAAQARGDQEVQFALSDRDLQDRIITYLTDANLRRFSAANDVLGEDEGRRAQRFSRFLARRYYRDRLQRGFHHSSAVISQADAASSLVDGQEFDAIVDNCVLGSFATAREVGQLAVASLLPWRQEAWWQELLEYEFAFFLQLATSEATPRSRRPQASVSTTVRSFGFRFPELLTWLRSQKPLPNTVRGNTTILFSRTPHGRIYVVELDVRTEAVFRAILRGEDLRQLASNEDWVLDEMKQTLQTLHAIGAVTSGVPNLKHPS